MRLALMLVLVFSSSVVSAEECPWMPTSRIDAAFKDRAPWSTMVVSQGRCKFVSDQRKPSSNISLTQMIKASPAEAQKYASTVAGGMAKSYVVTPNPSIGTAGVSVRQSEADGRMLTLIGHRDSTVVMTQLSFLGGVDEAQQSAAEALTLQTFDADTGGGLQLPSR